MVDGYEDQFSTPRKLQNGIPSNIMLLILKTTEIQ